LLLIEDAGEMNGKFKACKELIFFGKIMVNVKKAIVHKIK
jgi:hypothetical protein